MGKKVEFEQFDPKKGIFEGYIGWGLMQQQPLGTNRVKAAKLLEIIIEGAGNTGKATSAILCVFSEINAWIISLHRLTFIEIYDMLYQGSFLSHYIVFFLTPALIQNCLKFDFFLL